LRIDGELLASAAGPGVRVRLVRGNHAVRLSGTLESGPRPPLEWRPPDATQWRPVGTETLFVPPAGGLGLRLTLTPRASGLPSEEYVDPVVAHFFHVGPFARMHIEPQVWSADWVGQLDAPSAGTYSFSLDHSQNAVVRIDGRPILGNLTQEADTRNAVVPLTAGRHALALHFDKTAEGSPWINLYWTPPGEPPKIVPASVLYPDGPEVLGSAE
jgi:hypothetical protein